MMFEFNNKTLLCLVFTLVMASSAVLEFDNTAIEKIFQQKNPALFLFASNTEQSTAALEQFKAYDETNPEGVVLTVSSSEDGHGLFDRLAEYLGVDSKNAPVVLYFGAKSEKYRFEKDEITAETLAAFVNAVQAGEITQFLKSADIPEPNDEAVLTIVGQNFKSEILDSDKEFLVKFYAPWCGHCKTLAPHFEAAAKLLQETNPNIKLVKFDSTENEVAGIDIQGFPTLKFFGKDKSVDPIDFNGERDTNGIITWLKEHTATEWTDVEVADEPAADGTESDL